MSDAIIVGILAALASIISAILTSRATQRDVAQKLETSDAVQNTKIEALKKSVDKHNGFAERIPVLEEQVSVLNREMKEVKNELKARAS